MAKAKAKVSCPSCKFYVKFHPGVKFNHACLKNAKRPEDCTRKNKKANCRDFKKK